MPIGPTIRSPGATARAIYSKLCPRRRRQQRGVRPAVLPLPTTNTDALSSAELHDVSAPLRLSTTRSSVVSTKDPGPQFLRLLCIRPSQATGPSTRRSHCRETRGALDRRALVVMDMSGDTASPAVSAHAPTRSHSTESRNRIATGEILLIVTLRRCRCLHSGAGLQPLSPVRPATGAVILKYQAHAKSRRVRTSHRFACSIRHARASPDRGNANDPTAGRLLDVAACYFRSRHLSRPARARAR